MMKGMAQAKGGLDKFVDAEFQEKQRKKQEEEEKKLYAEIYGQTVAATETKRVQDTRSKDPKMKLCPFFKAGVCDKGRKCKYSHDVNIEAATGSANLYIDHRESDGKDANSMANWDQNKLEEVVNTNESKYTSSTTKTEKVCRNFLDAVEKKIYGWFWVCPNGHSCIYRHCLPPGFVLASETNDEDSEEEVALEEQLDAELLSLDTQNKNQTKVTLELFLQWKKKRLDIQKKEREARRIEEIKKMGHKKKLNKLLDGRSMFIFQKVDVQDAADANDDIEREYSDTEENMKTYKVHNLNDYMVQDEKEEKVEIDEDAFADEDLGDDGDDDDEDLE